MENNCEYDYDVFLPEVGAIVPEDLAFNAYHEGKIVPMSFKALRGQWVVLMFYPADFTFVCPTELEDMQSLHKEFVAEGATVISMSTDTVYAHKVWKEVSPAIGKIEYAMGADPSHEVCESFEVLIAEEGLAERATFIIDPEGEIKAIEKTHDAIGRSAKDTLRKLKAARFALSNPGNVCPANFDDGMAPLQPSIDLAGKM